MFNWYIWKWRNVVLKCLIGLLSPDGGSIKIDDQETIGQNRPQHEGLTKTFWYDLPVWRLI